MGQKNLIFLPFAQNIQRQPSPWLYKTFYCGCPYEKKSQNLVLPPLTAHLNMDPKTAQSRKGFKLGCFRRVEAEAATKVSDPSPQHSFPAYGFIS